MRLLIVGANGRLGKAFKDIQNHFDTIYLGKEDLDITNLNKCKEVFNNIKPDAVINCVAYTNVDLAEQEKEKCYSLNALGARNIAIASSEINAKLCHISTISVFDGEKKISDSYGEGDIPNPINFYGATKLLGEDYVKTFSNKIFIVRTNWLFGTSDNDFLSRMISYARKNKSISAIYDQYGSFTYINDLAAFCLNLISTDKYGIYNGVNSEYGTPYDFIKYAFEILNENINIEPILTEKFNFTAKRQRNYCLNNMSIIANNLTPIRNWKESLESFLKDNKNNFGD